MILPDFGQEGQAKLKQAKVLIIGVGGLGSPIAFYLAGAGVGTLGLMDDDRVSVSNLQRQVLYTEADVDQPKALCAARRLAALNSEIELRPYPTRLTADNAEAIIREYDIVVDGCDNFATRYLIDDVCRRLQKVYVYGAIREFEGQVSVFHYQEGSLSYRDLYPDEAEMQQLTAPLGVLGVTPAVVGSVQATETLKVITGLGQPLIGKLWLIDLLSMETNLLNLI